jgi:hypothetical protein
MSDLFGGTEGAFEGIASMRKALGLSRQESAAEAEAVATDLVNDDGTLTDEGADIAAKLVEETTPEVFTNPKSSPSEVLEDVKEAVELPAESERGPEPQVFAPDRRVDPEAEGGAAVPGRVVPAAAPVHAVGPGGFITSSLSHRIPLMAEAPPVMGGACDAKASAPVRS